MITHNLSPLLLCSQCHYSAVPPNPKRHPVPDVHADLKCPECSASMMLVHYAITESAATLGGLYMAVPMRGELRR